MNEADTQNGYEISAYRREREISGYPAITLVEQPQALSKIKGPAITIEEVLHSAFPRSVLERMDRSLVNLHRLSAHPGAWIDLDSRSDYPVLFSENEEAMLFIIGALSENEWIKTPEYGIAGSPPVSLTSSGWNRIAEAERASIISKQCFVAMWFDSNMDIPYSEGVEKAIKDAGFEPMRVDLKEHNSKICDAIIAEIRKSRFMVADFTGHRGGVYYEAGFAQGLGIPVIWTCREAEIDKTHFDTRQYNHIAWKDEHDLYNKLLRRIEATIPK